MIRCDSVYPVGRRWMRIPLLVQHRRLLLALRGAQGIAGRRRSGDASMAPSGESLVVDEWNLYHMMLYKVHWFNPA